MTYNARMAYFKVYFQEKWSGCPPFAKLFRTEFGEYLYDPGTNTLMKCSAPTFNAICAFQNSTVSDAMNTLAKQYTIDLVVRSLEEIAEAIEQHKILLGDPRRMSFGSRHFTDLEEDVNNNLGMITLEITERCNLRCRYCIYNDIVTETRNHGTTNMELATGYRAIDYLRSHSSHQKIPAVTFYGGEPLIRFPFIVKCVEYARTVFGTKDVSFAVTTNGTTLSSKIASFLSREDFNVTVSIDGPEDVHDEYRVYKNGRGTFARAMKGLRELIYAYQDRAAQKLTLSMVYTPPFSAERLQKVASLWRDCSWLGNIGAFIVYPRSGSIPREKLPAKGQLSEDTPLHLWAIERHLECYDKPNDVNQLAKRPVDDALLRIFRRHIFTVPEETIHLNGCCVPGARRIYVTTQGQLAVCERVHNDVPYIGHVDTGIDVALLKRVFVEDYDKNSLGRCASCWAHRLCGICYKDAFTRREFDDKKKEIICGLERKTKEEYLKAYSRCLHVDPKGLNYLADMEMR